MIIIAYVVFPVNTEITKLLFSLGLDAAYAGASDDLKRFFDFCLQSPQISFSMSSKGHISPCSTVCV